MEAISINDFNNHTIDEGQVIRRILAGEKELYEILVRRNNQKLYRIVRSYIKDREEIEDIMQDSYIKAFTKLYQFKLESSFSTWLVRITINETLSRLREKGRIRKMSLYSEEENSNLINQIPDNRQLNPQEKMMNSEMKQVLENAIDQLESKYRTVYIMKELEEMSLKEIASALDISLSNAKIRSHRAKEKLKELLLQITNEKEIFEFGFSHCDRVTTNVMNRI